MWALNSKTLGQCNFFDVFPQIAIAIGVLTSNRGGGRRTTLADWTWHQGAIAGCSGRGALGAIVRCHCSVLWLGGRVTSNFEDVVPLLGAIAGCHSSVLWLGGEGDDQLWGKWTCWVQLHHVFLLYSGPPISPRHPRKQQ